ncbi:MAG: MMPL family transporter [Deltaproteobacteria bacterium]|nr:MMPL family transporter [Deltaproteobacteria bacterium]
MKNDKTNNGFGAWVITYRWLIIVGTLLIVVVAGSGGRHLTFSNDYRYFFSKENPQLNAFEALQDTYSKNDNVLFAIAPKNGKVFTRETLAIIEELTEASWQVPYSIRVDSITNFQHTRAEEDDLIVEDLVQDAATLKDDDLAAIQTIALNEPLLAHRLISPSAHVTGVNVTINLPGKKLDEVPEVARFARKMTEDVRAKYPAIDLYLTGMTMMNNQFPEASQQDMATLIPIMFLVILVVMWLLIRSVAGTFSTTLVIAMSAITAMGLAGWYGIPLTGPSVSAPTIILTLAVADSIHFLVTMFYNMRHGMSKREAIVESLRVNVQPIFLTSITTAIGFMSMNFSDAPPFRDLGNIVAVGVLFAFFFSILFLPALMSLLPVRIKPYSDDTRHVMDRFADFVVRRRRALFRGMLLFIILMIAGLSRIEFNDQFVEYFDTRYTFRTDTDFVTNNLTGIYNIDYSLNAGGEGMVSDPEYLAKVDAFAAWYRKQEGVLHVNTITDTMKRLNRNMHGDRDDYYSLPETRDLAAQYLLLYELSLPYGLDLNNQIDIKKSATRFGVTLSNISTSELLALEERAQLWLRENAPESMWFHGASPTVMFSHIAKRNIRSMLLGTGIALVLISAILMFALKSFRIGIISLIPNLIPAFMAFGLWGILFKDVGLALAVVTAMSLGIVVDDTVHFLSKYLRARREHGMNIEESVRYSFRTVGMALWVTSIILVAGFTVLTYSGFALNSDMGLLTAIAIGFALLADFLFLPTLLMKMKEGKE